MLLCMPLSMLLYFALPLDNSILQKFPDYPIFLNIFSNGRYFQFSSRCLILLSIVSLARKILERTVPTGQSMISVISS